MTFTKPIIASPQWEYDSRTLALADQAQVATWTDSKPGGGTDATASTGFVKYGAVGGPDEWNPTTPGVIFDTTPGPDDTMGFSPSSMTLSDITLFAVIKTTDLTSGCAIIGTTDGIDPPTGIYLLVYPDGSVHFIIGHNGAVAAKDLGSASGIFKNRKKGVITARLDIPSGGMIIRVNGFEVAKFVGVELGSDFWFSPKVRQCNLPVTGSFPGAITGDDQNMPWVAGYSSAASDGEIDQMEEYLGQEFDVQIGPVDFPRVVLPKRVTTLGTPGAVKRRTNSGLSQIRSGTAIGWSWEEEWDLLRVTDKDDMEMLAFVRDAWHSGKDFKILHRMWPGSGITPNGLGTASIMVVGGGQVGPVVLTDGWPVDTPNCVVAGDVVSIAGELAVYMVTGNADSNASGEVSIGLNPPLRSSPANNSVVRTTDVEFVGTIMGRSRFEGNGAPTSFAGLRVRIEESIL